MMNTLVPSKVNLIFYPGTREVMTYCKLIENNSTKAIWENVFAKKLGRLANSVGDRIPTRTNTIFFIPSSQIPSDWKATYGKILCEFKPHKLEKCCSRLTVRGNCANYPFPVSTPIANITEFKCLINSILSTSSAKLRPPISATSISTRQWNVLNIWNFQSTSSQRK